MATERFMRSKKKDFWDEFVEKLFHLLFLYIEVSGLGRDELIS
jgi:hypothetical protein